jgi:S-adenosylmethionine:tRNA ribosyltransferase-isomerase
LKTSDFDFHLPPELIAQQPMVPRDQSRLLVLLRDSRQIEHRRISDLPQLLNPGDLLVFNNSKVIPARLSARKREGGGSVEVFLVEEVKTNRWWTLVRPGKRVKPGAVLDLLTHDGTPSPISAHALEKNAEGHCLMEFLGVGNLGDALGSIGEVPLPPYIDRKATSEDCLRYQTVFAKAPGSVAAPTAGLHFTPELLVSLERAGIKTAEVTLHVGLGTFAPVKTEELDQHRMHEERFEIASHAASEICNAKARGKRVIAVGTTSLRVLESAASQQKVQAHTGRTRLFLYPPANFQVVDALLTNFHLPRSTLLMLVSAFASPGSTEGRETILKAYETAVRERYRFFSYGDAMLLL